MTSSKSIPRSRSRAAAWIRIAWPFCSTIRPMFTSRGADGHRCRTVVQEHRTDPDMDHVDLGPVAVISPAIELAPRELADRDHEPGMMDLLAQASGPRGVELLGAVHGEAVGRPSENPAEHGGGRRVGPVMGMDVVDSQLGCPLQQDAGLGEVDQRSHQAPVVDSTHLHGQPERPGEGPGTPQGRLSASPPGARARRHRAPIESSLVPHGRSHRPALPHTAAARTGEMAPPAPPVPSPRGAVLSGWVGDTS